MPTAAQRYLLKIVRRFLDFKLAGSVKLVHAALIITGLAFAASSADTYRLANTPLPEALAPNQRMAALGRRWREERNFWIACLTFLLWGLLYRFQVLLQEHVRVVQRVRQLEAEAAKRRD